jgi:hypothetical protein
MNQSLQGICAWQNQQDKVCTCTMVIVLENFAKEFMQKIWAQVIGTNLGCK